MTTLRHKRNIAAVSTETPENTKKVSYKTHLIREWLKSTSSRFLKGLKGGSLERLSKEFSRMESRILGALSKLDELLLNPQVRTCSVAVPGTSSNSDSENREPTGDRSLNDPCPEAVLSFHHSGNLNGSELEETHHTNFIYECRLYDKIEKFRENTFLFRKNYVIASKKLHEVVGLSKGIGCLLTYLMVLFNEYSTGVCVLTTSIFMCPPVSFFSPTVLSKNHSSKKTRRQYWANQFYVTQNSWLRVPWKKRLRFISRNSYIQNFFAKPKFLALCGKILFSLSV